MANVNPKEDLLVSEGMLNEYHQYVAKSFGVKVSSTVSGKTVSFTNAAITSSKTIDGPYIADVLVGIESMSSSGTTITYTLEDESANGKTAVIFVRDV